MHKYVKVIIFTLVVALFLPQIAFAKESNQKPPKPTEGIESSDPKNGRSPDINLITTERASGLLTDWKCSISNSSGTNLTLSGSSTANTVADQITLTLYLQKWNGSNWVDINSWPFNETFTAYIYKSTSTTCQSGYYYRVRAVHTTKKGSQSETQNSTSTYIYVG